MIIKNVKIYTEDKTFAEGEIRIRDGLFQEVRLNGTEEGLQANKGYAGTEEANSADAGCAGVEEANSAVTEEIIDGAGAYAIPGLIDLHFHGCKGYDFCDGTYEAITEIAKYEAKIGVTAISPATMTLPVEVLEQILATAAAYQKEAPEKNPEDADLIGVNM